MRRITSRLGCGILFCVRKGALLVDSLTGQGNRIAGFAHWNDEWLEEIEDELASKRNVKRYDIRDEFIRNTKEGVMASFDS